MSDGAKGMRALVASVAPTLSKPTLDWFHLAMKIQTLRPALGACAMTQSRRPAFMARIGTKVCDLLWRGRTDEALELIRTLIESLSAEAHKFAPFYASAAETARGAASRLLAFVRKNRADIVDYNQVRRSGRRISTAATKSVMNQVINWRMSNSQQMRWSISGAQRLPRTRVAMLDESSGNTFLRAVPALQFPRAATPEAAGALPQLVSTPRSFIHIGIYFVLRQRLHRPQQCQAQTLRLDQNLTRHSTEGHSRQQSLKLQTECNTTLAPTMQHQAQQTQAG